MKLDADTQKVLTEADHLKAMVESEGWQIAERKLLDKLIDLQSVLNVDDSSAEKALADMKARVTAVTLIKEWLQKDIHGFILQQENVKAQLSDTPTNTFIDRR